MRKLSSTLLLIGICLSLSAQTESIWSVFRDKTNFVLEWGYAQSVFEHHHFNLSSAEGYRINENESSIYLQPNAFAMLGIQFNASKFFSFSLSSGIEGIYRNCSIVPLRLKLNYYYNGSDSDGFLSYCSGGIGLRSDESLMRNTVGTMINIGEGYRLRLANKTYLDLLVSARAVFANPLIPNPDGSGFAPEENIRYNAAEIFALCVSFALSF